MSNITPTSLSSQFPLSYTLFCIVRLITNKVRWFGIGSIIHPCKSTLFFLRLVTRLWGVAYFLRVSLSLSL